MRQITKKGGLMFFFLIVLAGSALALTNTVFDDVDGDGNLDVYLEYLIQNNGSAFINRTNESNIPVFANIVRGAFVDMNGDGDEDLYIVLNGSENQIYFRNSSVSNWNFTNATNTAVGQRIRGLPNSPIAAAFVDFDNDGDYDAFVNGELWMTVTTFADFNASNRSNIDEIPALNNVKAVDVNLDNRTDLIGVTTTETLIVYLNLGDTNGDNAPEFYPATVDIGLHYETNLKFVELENIETGLVLNESLNYYPFSGETPPFVLDQFQDFYMVKEAGSANVLYSQTWPELPEPYSEVDAPVFCLPDLVNLNPTNITDTGPGSLAILRDFDNNNFTDVLIANRDVSSSIMVRNSSSWYQRFSNSTANFTNTTDMKYVETADLDSDGELDFAVIDDSQIYLQSSTGAGLTTQTPIENINTPDLLQSGGDTVVPSFPERSEIAEGPGVNQQNVTFESEVIALTLGYDSAAYDANFPTDFEFGGLPLSDSQMDAIGIIEQSIDTIELESPDAGEMDVEGGKKTVTYQEIQQPPPTPTPTPTVAVGRGGGTSYTRPKTCVRFNLCPPKSGVITEESARVFDYCDPADIFTATMRYNLRYIGNGRYVEREGGAPGWLVAGIYAGDVFRVSRIDLGGTDITISGGELICDREYKQPEFVEFPELIPTPEIKDEEEECKCIPDCNEKLASMTFMQWRHDPECGCGGEKAEPEPAPAEPPTTQAGAVITPGGAKSTPSTQATGKTTAINSITGAQVFTPGPTIEGPMVAAIPGVEGGDECKLKKACEEKCVITPCQNTYITFDALTKYIPAGPYSALRWTPVPVELEGVVPEPTPRPPSVCGNGKLEAGEECEIGTCLPPGLICAGCKVQPTKPGAGQRGNVRLYEVYTYQEEEVSKPTTPSGELAEEAATLTAATTEVLVDVAEPEDFAADYRFFEIQMDRKARAEERVMTEAAGITGAAAFDVLTADTKTAEAALTAQGIAIEAGEVAAFEAALGAEQATAITLMPSEEKRGITREHELGELHSVDVFATYEEQELPAGTIFAYVHYVQDLRAQQEAINEKMKEASTIVSSIFDIINNNLFGLEESDEFDNAYEARGIINQKIEEVTDYFYFGENFFKDLDMLIDYSADLKIMQQIQEGLQALAEFTADNYPLSRSQMEAAQEKYQELTAALEEVKSRLPSMDRFEYAVDVPIEDDSLPAQEPIPETASELPAPEEKPEEEEEEKPPKDKSEEFFQRGYTAYQKGEYSDAVGWLAKSLKENPQMAEAMWVMTKTLEKKGEYGLATKTIEPITQITEWEKKIQPYAAEEIREIKEKKIEEPEKTFEEQAYSLLAQKAQTQVTPEEKVIQESEYVLFDICVKNNQEFLYKGEKYKFLHVVQKEGTEYSATTIRSKDSAKRELSIQEFRDKLYEQKLCMPEAEEEEPEVFGREPREKELPEEVAACQPHVTIGPDGKEYVCCVAGQAMPTLAKPTAVPEAAITQTKLTQRLTKEAKISKEKEKSLFTRAKEFLQGAITGRVIDAGGGELTGMQAADAAATSLAAPQTKTGPIMIGGEMCMPATELPADLLEEIKIEEIPEIPVETVLPEQEPIQRFDWLARREVELYELTHAVTVPVYSGEIKDPSEEMAATLHKMKGSGRVKNAARLYVGKDLRKLKAKTKEMDNSEWEKLKLVEAPAKYEPECTFETGATTDVAVANKVTGVSCQDKDKCTINADGKIICEKIFSTTCKPSKPTEECVSDFDAAGCYFDAESNPICPGYSAGECTVEDSEVICGNQMMGGCTFGEEVTCEGFDSCEIKDGEVNCENEAEKMPPGCSEEDGKINCLGYMEDACTWEEGEVMCAESMKIPEGCERVGDTFVCEDYIIPDECKLINGEWDCGNLMTCGFGEETIECWTEPSFETYAPRDCVVEQGEGGVNMICGEGMEDISNWPPGCSYINEKFVCAEPLNIPPDCSLGKTGVNCPDRTGYCGFDKDKNVVCQDVETTFYEGYNYENGRLSTSEYSSEECGYKDGAPYCKSGVKSSVPLGCEIIGNEIICNNVPLRIPEGVKVEEGKVTDEEGNECYNINGVWRCTYG